MTETAQTAFKGAALNLYLAATGSVVMLSPRTREFSSTNNSSSQYHWDCTNSFQSSSIQFSEWHWANKNIINLRGLTQVKESRPFCPVHRELCAERPALPRRWRWRHAVQASSLTAGLPDPVNIIAPHISHSCHVTGIHKCPTLTMSYLLLVTWLSKGVHDMSCYSYLHISTESPG